LISARIVRSFIREVCESRPPSAEGLKAMKLHRAALEERISILPGVLFSATGQYKNYIRINGGRVWTKTHDRALLTLGRLCERQA